MVVVTNCESTADWTAFNGAIHLDMVDFQQGSASIKAVGDATDHDFVYAIYNPDGVWDWSSEDHLTFWFKASEITDIRCKVYSGANEGLDFVEWARQFKQQVPVADTWYRVKLYKDDFDDSNGALDWSAVKAIRLRMYQTGTAETFHVDEILIDDYDPIKAKIGATTGLEYVSDDVLELDIWGDDLQVGRWQLILKNIANKYGGRFHASEDAVLEINTVSMMKGYVDDVFPFLGDRGYYTNKLKVVGRDFGRDLARLMYSNGYVDTKGDDIVEDILVQKGSEITFNSPSTAAIIPIERSRTYLIDWVHDVGAELNFSGYVDQSKALQFFPIGTVSSGIALKSIQGSVDNNILHLLKGEEIGFSIANAVELSAGSLIDHYSDGNKADFTLGAGTAIANETTLKIAGLSSIKFSNAGAAKPAITLDFSGAGLYSHAGLDLSLGDQLSFYIRHNNVAERVMIKLHLEDNAGNVIEFFRGSEGGSTSSLGKTLDVPANEWHKIQISYGDNIELQAGLQKNNRWYNVVGGAFSWSNVVKITWQAVQMLLGVEENLSATDLYLDAFTVPTVEVISLVADAVSDAAYGTSEWFDQRDDIKTQIELDLAAASELEKRKDPLKNIMVIAKGDTGIKYAGQTVTVQAPKHGLAGATTYRIVSYHHQYRKGPIYKGHSFVTTLDLISDDLSPATQFFDPSRYRLNRDPVGAALESLALTRRRVRSSQTTQRKQYGVTHPSVKVIFSGSGVAFPEDPVDGFVFKLTTDITNYYAATYEYDGDVPDWTRDPMLLTRTVQPPAGGEVEGDTWHDPDAGTDGITYVWSGAAWVKSGVPSHDDIDDVGASDHHSAFTAGDHLGVEHLASMLAIEVRPWTSNFNVIWDEATPDYNELFYGKAGDETDTDADIVFADGTTDKIKFSTENGVPDGLWYLYWDDTQKTGDDYDVQRTDDVLVATGVGKGLLATVVVDAAGPNPPSIIPWGGYKPYVSAGVMAARFITAGMLIANFVIGTEAIKTGAGVQWAAGGDPGVIFTGTGIRCKGAAGAIMAEILAADGKITAGGGTVVLDNLGLTVSEGGEIIFHSDTEAADVAQMVPYFSGPGTFGTMLQALNAAELSFGTANGLVRITDGGTIYLDAATQIYTKKLLPQVPNIDVGSAITPYDNIHGNKVYGAVYA